MNGWRKINNISAFTYGKYMRTEKITFKGSSELKLGDTLKGVVIKQDSEGNNVTIKLTNGMEIDAELQGEVDLKGGILNFEVIDLKDNTLFLKLASNNKEVIKEQGGNEGIDEIMNFILKEGLKKEEYNMLKAMVKYNIPLTRENITTVKSIMEFSYKMNNNPTEIKSFINTYLNSRDIVANSREGFQIAQKLYEFFQAFSKSDLNEVLLFLENDIEFTKENLDSFNKLFNSENTMEKVIISKNLAENVTKKSEEAKEVIRNIISNLKESNENSTQILNIMKESINDLKLFNKINDQYYCLDVPVNFKDNEYPCKLIIKDDRKGGKVIDSSNFKIAVSVKTVKLGTVDALLDVKNRNIDIQLKCDKNVMKLFVISKDKLKDIVE